LVDVEASYAMETLKHFSVAEQLVLEIAKGVGLAVDSLALDAYSNAG
jgi:hypothetical protein